MLLFNVTFSPENESELIETVGQRGKPKLVYEGFGYVSTGKASKADDSLEFWECQYRKPSKNNGWESCKGRLTVTRGKPHKFVAQQGTHICGIRPGMAEALKVHKLLTNQISNHGCF